MSSSFETWDVCTTSHWNIAEQLHLKAKDKFRYLGSKKWEYYDENDSTWKKDVHSLKLKRFISNDLYEELMQRILYWQILNKSEDKDNYDINFKILNFLQISTMLKKLEQITAIIKEAKEFFVVDQ